MRSWGPLKARQGPGLECCDRAGPFSRLPATPFPACPRWGPPRSPTPSLGALAAKPRNCSIPAPRARSGPVAGGSLTPFPSPILRGKERLQPRPHQLSGDFIRFFAVGPAPGVGTGLWGASLRHQLEDWGTLKSQGAGKVA